MELTRALKMELAADPKRARRVADKLFTMAEEGDINAAKLIFERLEGKADQHVNMNHSGEVTHSYTPSERRERIRELIAGQVVDAVEDAQVVSTDPVTSRRRRVARQ